MTTEELKERQSWSLEKKIDHSLEVIETFHSRLDGNVYVSFSGGKDSTIVLWLATKLFPDIKAVFCNTGNEYPDIVKFVRSLKNEGRNIEIIYPKLKPKEVMQKYGFPLISKEQSRAIYDIRHSTEKMRNYRLYGDGKRQSGVLSEKWRPLLEMPCEISNKCCQKLKKDPFHHYEKSTGLHPILGTMASESRLREKVYMQRGNCNSFGENGGRISSQPLSVWLEQDVWDCIERYHIPIADIYRKGAKRTGCMFCGYGCQFKDDNRLQMVHELYPKAYDMFMNYTNNGVTYRQALRSVLDINGIYLPDEVLF